MLLLVFMLLVTVLVSNNMCNASVAGNVLNDALIEYNSDARTSGISAEMNIHDNWIRAFANT
jgi:hypothetical protein